jgi:hypothetical protein
MRFVGALTLLLAVLPLPLRGQAIDRWLPALGDLYGYTSQGEVNTYVLEGVPGERVNLRLVRPKPTSSANLALELLQGTGEPQTFVVAPSGPLTVKDIVFDDTGAVVLRVKSNDGLGGAWLLRARSKLPKGAKKPDVVLVPGETPKLHVSAWLRPQMWLEAKVRLPHAAPDFPGGEPLATHIPPALIGPPYELALFVPPAEVGKAYPDVVKLSNQSYGNLSLFEQVSIDVPADGIHSMKARVRRHKPVYDKPLALVPPEMSPPAPFYTISVNPDQFEVLPGQPLLVTFEFVAKDTAVCTGAQLTAEVWLSSLHRYDATPGGTLLAGPLPVEVPQIEAAQHILLTTEIEVPVDASPGLWGIWVVLRTQGATGACDLIPQMNPPGAAVIRVLAP